MKTIYETVLELLSAGESIVLARLIANSGSTPREAGAKMIIRRNGEIAGTIGGGKIEAEVMKIASEIFAGGKSSVRYFDLSPEGIASIGMICGGDASVYMQYLDASDKQLVHFYQAVTASISRGEPSWLITKMIEEDGKFEQCFLTDHAEHPENPGRFKLDEIIPKLDSRKMLLRLGGDTYTIERITTLSKTFIFGGGHVGHALVPVLGRIGFHTSVIDDRPEFSDRGHFEGVDETLTSDFEESFKLLDIDENSYIVIVTRGHLHDYAVLKKALRTPACYIGMIGSASKWASLQEMMLGEGFSKTDIARVHAPIGTRIKAETPEEIAISIAGEMILARAERDEANR